MLLQTRIFWGGYLLTGEVWCLFAKDLLFLCIFSIMMFLFQEYMEDGIDWTNVEFVDNTDCLNLFEKVYLFCASNYRKSENLYKAKQTMFIY